MIPKVTLKDMQAAVAERLRSIFTGAMFNSVSGSRKAVTVFKQNLPVPSASDDDIDNDPSATSIPYIIVRIADGKQQDDESSVSLLLIFGVYDQAAERSGYLDVLEMIERITENFSAHPNLGAYEIPRDFEWTLNQDDAAPFDFGAMQIKVKVPACAQEPDNDLV